MREKTAAVGASAALPGAGTGPNRGPSPQVLGLVTAS